MGKILDKICEIMAVLACLLLLFITFSIAYSIFSRPLKLPSLIWVVQFNEYSLLWITFLGTAWLLSQGKHVNIQFLTHRFKERTNKALALIHNFMGFALSGLLCWFGAHTTVDHFIRKVIDVQSVDIQKGLVIMVIPIGFFFLTLQFLRKFIILLVEYKKTGAGETAEDVVLEENEYNGKEGDK